MVAFSFLFCLAFDSYLRNRARKVVGKWIISAYFAHSVSTLKPPPRFVRIRILNTVKVEKEKSAT